MLIMSTNLIRDRNFLIGALKKNSFFYSDCYIAAISLFTALFHCANASLLGLCSFAALACFLLVAYRDLTPFIPLPLFVVLIFRNFYIFDNTYTFIIFVPVAICLVLHFVLYPIKKLFLGKLFVPLLAVIVVLFTGGLFSEYSVYFMRGLVTVATLGPVIFFAYFLFSNYICPPKDVNLSKYIFTVLTFIGITCFIEVSVNNYIHVPNGGVRMTLGWGNINSAAAMMLLSIPSCVYLLLYTKNTVRNLLFLVALYATVFMSRSDGVGGISLVFIPIIIISTMTAGSLKINKYEIFKKVVFFLLCILIIAVISIVAFGKHVELLEMLWLKLSDDSERSKLYREAFLLFKKYPIFGVGQGYIPENSSLILSSVVTYNFHSTFFHVAATMGCFGLIVYLYYFINRYKIITERNNPANLFVYFAFTMFEIYAAVDTGEFSVIPLMLCVTLMLTTLEHINIHPTSEPLPLALHLNFTGFIPSSLKKIMTFSTTKNI